LGWIQAYNLDWQAAEASQRKALSLEPGNATVQLQAGWLFAELGHLDEGLTLIDKASRWIHCSFAVTSFMRC
jgi:Tfp pilus assembly protein PilF